MPDERGGPELPTGTITFVLTDVEGSTQLWEVAPAAMGEAMAIHDALIEQAVVRDGGSLVRPRGEGDSRFAVFARAHDAVAGARDVQLSMAAQLWPTPTPLCVRIALHTGEADLRTGDYYGSDVNRCARLRAIGHGGQTLLSQSTFGLVRDSPPENVTLRDLGEHRLKDLQRPEHVFQLCVAGLPADFPPLLSVDAFRNNLPAQLTSFIGRDRELDEVKGLLSNTRLLTLTGPGGTGKTRLSLQLAADVLPEFSDGAWLVELAPLSDPSLIAQTIATTLGVRDQPGRTILDSLTDYVRAKTLLLILDNCEHLIEASAKLANTLLQAAPGLKILASSREALGITGETAYRVPSLPLPERADLAGLVQNECVRLFVDRARAVYPAFHLSQKNTPAVAEICRRLDGIPLAIELAAARTRMFPAEQIAERLDDRFRLLTGGSRAALERHQTLRALIDWSYDLLPEAECVLLRRLSVFAGGWTLEAAQVVCGERPCEEVLDLLTHLVDKSLVVVETQEGEGRYRFLETIRQYARDKLFESGEAERVRDRHLGYYLRYAEGAEPKLRSGEQVEWLQRLEREHDNLRTALAWSLESRKSETALRLSGALFYFWELRGMGEGCRWLDEALALSAPKPTGKAGETAQRAKALYGSGRLRCMILLDWPASRTLVEESLRLWRELEDKWWMAVALENLGFLSNVEGDTATARVRLEEGVALAREVGDPWLLAFCLERLAGAVERTDPAAGRRIREEGVAAARVVGDRSVLSEGLGDLAGSYLLEGNSNVAASLGEEALAAAREIRDLIHELIALLILVIIKCTQGDTVKAEEYCYQGLEAVRETGSTQWLLLVPFAFGYVTIFNGQAGRGVRLLAATAALAAQRDMNLGGDSSLSILFKPAHEKAHAQLDPVAFEAAWAKGLQMTLEEALALATSDQP